MKLYVIVNFVARAHAHAVEKIYVLMYVRLISSARFIRSVFTHGNKMKVWNEGKNEEN